MAARQRQPIFRLKTPCTIIQQIKSFRSQVFLQKSERLSIRKKIMDDLKPHLHHSLGTSCILHIFGSMKYGLTLVGSDLDLFVETDAQYENHRTLIQLSEELQGDKRFAEVEAIPHANVPIITMMHVPTATKCDIAFTGEFTVEDSDLFIYYLNLHPRFFDVMLLIKFWAKKLGICGGREAISSYGWTLMFICFLQTLKDPYGGPGLVKSVFELQKTKLSGRRVGDFLVEFDRRKLDFKLPNDERYSHLALLNGFFNYYRMYSFEGAVLCPYLGKAVQRVASPHLAEATSQAESHVAKLRMNTDMTTAEYLTILQCPFDHRAYVACKNKCVSKVHACISKAALLCEQYMQYSIDHESMFLEQLFS